MDTKEGGNAWYSRHIIRKLTQIQADEASIKGELGLWEREREIMEKLIQGIDSGIATERIGLGTAGAQSCEPTLWQDWRERAP